VTIHPSDTLGKLFDRFYATRLHRLFLVDAEQRPVRVISLSDVLGLLARATHGL
jgi:CBS-domain-containing membrane protein